MPELAHTLLSLWESFYVIVGSSAAALIGLQFVVIVLIADQQERGTNSQIAAFGTPNVVHFVAALFLAAALSAPWHTMQGPSALLGMMGLAGLGYAFIIARRATSQSQYKLVFEDWTWHIALPLIAYGTVGIAAMLLRRDAENALFLVGGTALLLLFIGIHNAWDTVTFVASGEWRKPTPPVSNTKKRK